MTPSMKAVSFLAISLAFVASIFAAGAYFRVRATHPPGAAGSGGEVDALRARVSKLEAEVARSREEGRQPAGEAGHDHSPPAGSGDLADLKKRVEALERRANPPRPGPGEVNRISPNPAIVEMQKKRLMDPAQPERARASALGMLRSQGANKADDVVEAGLALLEGATEPNIRALILRNLRGAENARVIPSLLGLLKSDPDEDVRDEAARTVGEYKAQAEVRTALEQAASQDASAKVKRTASAALGTPEKK